MPERRTALLTTGLAGLALAVALTACGGEGPHRSDSPQARFERALEAMPGVADAGVRVAAFDTDYFGEDAYVDMDVDVSPEELTAVLDALGSRTAEQGGVQAPPDAHVTLGAGTTDTEGDMFAAGSPPLIRGERRHSTNVTLAARFLHAVRALPGRGINANRSEMVINADTRGDVRDEMDAIVRAIAPLPDVAGFRGLNLDVVGDDFHALQLAPAHALTPAVLRRWHAATALLDDARVRKVAAYGADLEVAIDLPDEPSPRELTTTAYGEQVWPLAHRVLDLMADAPEGSRVAMTSYRFPGPGQDMPLEDTFLRVTVGRPGHPTSNGRTWNVAAADYLDQVRATR